MNWEYNRAIGWYGLVSSFGIIGLIFGFVIGVNSDEDNLYIYLIGFSALGILVGFVIARFLTKYAPTSQATDLDSFQDRYIDKTKDDILLELLPVLDDSELITAFAYQYYDLLKSSRTKIIKEIISREISKTILRAKYESNVLDFRGYKGECPRCGSNRYNSDINPEKPNCIICDYNIVRDNPVAFHNKLKKMFGMYNDRRLSWSEMEEHLNL